MRSVKQEALAVIDALPEDATFEDIRYRLYVIERIREGLADIEAGRVVSHEEVEADLAKWLAG